MNSGQFSVCRMWIPLGIALVMPGCDPVASEEDVLRPVRYGVQVIPGPVYAYPPLQSGQVPTTIRGDLRLQIAPLEQGAPHGMAFGGGCLYFQPLEKKYLCMSHSQCEDLEDDSGAVVGNYGGCDFRTGALGEILPGTCWWKPAVATVDDQPCYKHPKLTPQTAPMPLNIVFSTKVFDSSVHGLRAWRIQSCQWLDEPGCNGGTPDQKRLRWGPVWIPGRVPKMEAPEYLWPDDPAGGQVHFRDGWR